MNSHLLKFSFVFALSMVYLNPLKAQFIQYQDDPTVESTSDIVNYYSYIYNTNDEWKIIGRDKGIVDLNVLENSNNSSFKYETRDYQNQFDYKFIDINLAGDRVLSDHYGLIAVAKNGDNFTQYYTSTKSQVVWNNDTLFGITPLGTNTANIVLSTDYGVNWDTLPDIVPYFKDKSRLISSRNGGSPIYRVSNPSTFASDLFEVYSTGVNRIVSGKISSYAIAANKDYIIHQTYDLGQNNIDLMKYDRKEQYWENINPVSFPIDFFLRNICVEDNGIWHLIGYKKTSLGDEWVIYNYDGNNWEEKPFLLDTDVYQLVCSEEECFIQTKDGIYFSTDNASSWEQYSLFNNQIHSLAANGEIIYFTNKDGVFQLDGSNYDKLYTFNPNAKIISSEIFSNNDYILVHCSTKDDKNFTFLSKNRGQTWNPLNLPKDQDFMIYSIDAQFAIGQDINTDKLYLLDISSQTWKILDNWSIYSKDLVKAIMLEGEIFFLDNYYYGIMHSSDQSSTLKFIDPIVQGYTSYVADIAVIDGSLYTLTTATHHTKASISVLFRRENNEWKEICRSNIVMHEIIDVKDNRAVFRKNNHSQREINLYEYQNGEIKNIYSKIPSSAVINQVHCSSDNIYIATENFGLWYMQKTNLNMEAISSNREKQLLAYPNPSTQYQNIHFKWDHANISAQLRIYDLLGKEVFSKNIYNNEDVEHNLQKGLYLFEMQFSTDHKSSGKLIIQ